MHVFLLLYLICFFPLTAYLSQLAQMGNERRIWSGSLEFPFDCCWQVHATDGGNEYGWRAFLFSMMIWRWLILHSSRDENCTCWFPWLDLTWGGERWRKKKWMKYKFHACSIEWFDFPYKYRVYSISSLTDIYLYSSLRRLLHLFKFNLTSCSRITELTNSIIHINRFIQPLNNRSRFHLFFFLRDSKRRNRR